MKFETLYFVADRELFPDLFQAGFDKFRIDVKKVLDMNIEHPFITQIRTYGYPREALQRKRMRKDLFSRGMHGRKKEIG
ncbi:hypothetical protein ABD67_18355 [Bacillus sonorensis]|uniref:hypothetical protein n=1 Tax=Bacillus sonorensis TaxID=119858 RepID=UPI001F511D91|nr:hypothetical protein [Bacillus sonorensis]MBG9916774.1 hypothetical protein [Bacillus sonorensis]MCY8025260.1 hypothetical protein [Bacillus sonorensis]